jgi:hypothetical protein
MSLFKKANELYLAAGQKAGALFAAPTKTQTQVFMLAAGALILTAGLDTVAHAAGSGSDGVELEYNDDKIATAVKAIFTFLEGSFGALVMVVAGLGAIMSAAFGQYKAALGCLVVAVGAFILRSFVYTFFNTETIEGAL